MFLTTVGQYDRLWQDQKKLQTIQQKSWRPRLMYRGIRTLSLVDEWIMSYKWEMREKNNNNVNGKEILQKKQTKSTTQHENCSSKDQSTFAKTHWL